MVDYARDMGAASFGDVPFGEIDQAILAQLVYLPLKRALPSPSARMTMSALSQALEDETADKIYEILLRDRLQLLHTCGQSARYEDLLVSGFVNDISHEDEMQFCAMVVTLPDHRRAVCFRGTDLTLAGWKEDLNMSFDEPTPAQRRAVEYINEHADVPSIVLGHSKGGNLAVYGSTFCDAPAQSRITQVYTNDGPGLSPASAGSAAYQAIAPRIISLLPQNSLVGVLLSQHKPYQVVYSRAVGLLEHNPFSWEVERQSHAFVRRKELSRTSLMMDETMDEWLARMSLDERRTFADTLYEVLSASESKTLGELVKNPRRSAERMLKAMKGIDPMTRKAVRQLIARFFSVGAEVLVSRTAEALGIDQDKDKNDEPPDASISPK
ncbi:MAG: Mbeg1-like protein [Christensenellales bacterium]|jgi:hypothetical protein